jgi:ethanolamine permease
MSEIKGTQGVSYNTVDGEYFEKRGLRRYAGVFSLWALGVGAVISGDFSGWNFGLGFGWGSMFVATIIIAIMYLGLTYSIAEMSPALPHTGGAYSFARSWGRRRCTSRSIGWPVTSYSSASTCSASNCRSG